MERVTADNEAVCGRREDESGPARCQLTVAWGHLIVLHPAALKVVPFSFHSDLLPYISWCKVNRKRVLFKKYIMSLE